MSNKLMKMALASFLAFMQAGAQAEDIDLFAKNPAESPANVLIVLDNSSNWAANNQGWPTDPAAPAGCGNDCNSKQGYYELKAIRTVISGLPTDASGNVAMNIGLMMFNGPTAARKGGYVRFHVRQMTAANRQAFLAKLDEIIINFNQEQASSTVQYGAALFDAFKYFGGFTNPASDRSAPPGNPSYSGIPVFGTDFWGSNTANGTRPDDAAYEGNEYEAIEGIPCGKNFIVLIGNGFPASDSTASSNMGEVLRKLTNPTSPPATITEFPLIATNSVPTGTAVGRYADEFADFLRRTDVEDDEQQGQQNVVTYAIDVYRNSPDANQTALMRNVAKYGGGKYFAATNEVALKEAFDDIFSEILSVNSAFASASLPVSVNTQGTYLNQVFIGMFRPEKTPRWYGNLKQYQFRADVDSSGNIVGLTLADKDNKDAINSQNGFVSSCRKSFWTPSTADTYWNLAEAGSCTDPGARASNSPDGEVVEKGAAAYKLRGLAPADRNVTTCADATCSAGLVDFDTSTGPSATNLGVASADRDNLINWVRGLNVDAEVVNPSTTVMRPSVHGDVVHSRPLAIDYGGDTGVVVFYGGNDGMLRAIDGNKLESSGSELWSFVAPEHHGKLKRLRSNSPAISYPAATYDPADPTPEPKGYFIDGPMGVYRNGSSVWIYPTMRRGGDALYSFDVSDPSSPTLKWKRGPSELSNIGQTWSEPKVVKVAGYASSPVIIMGGGYDACEDQDAAPNTACTSPKGNRVFVLNANNGTVLRTLGTGLGGDDAILRSIAADVTVVDSDGDGYTDVAYAVDTGANVYRINIGSGAPGDWTIKKIAALGCNDSAACSRKFLHAPEVVVGAGFNAVLVGSGNRESPLMANAATNVDNAFFMIKDDRSSEQALITTSDLVAVDPNLASTTTQQAELALSSNKGWYLALGTPNSNPTLDHDKEQVVTSAVVVAGVVYFSTHTPAVPTACDTGLARGYTVNYLDASSPDGGSIFTKFAGGGLPPSPVAGVVSVTLTNADGTTVTDTDGDPVTANVPFVIGGGGVSGIDPTLVTVNPSGVRGRVYWYLEQ